MAQNNLEGHLTPLQRAIYETDLLELNLRDSMRLVTQRVGFFVGQQRYVAEQKKIAEIVARYGPPAGGENPMANPREATHQIGSAS